MGTRSPARQSAHDKAVSQKVKQLEKQGWEVSADLPGRSKPKGVGSNGYIPDIEAHKAGHRKLVEVETPESLPKDREQQSAFRRSVAQKHNDSFDIIVTDS